MKTIVISILFSCCVFLQAAKVDSKKLEGIFNKKGQWCFFTTQDSKYNRLTYLDKNQYKICKEGDLFKKISYKGKYYARDLNKKIYKPHWQMKKDFSTHLIPAQKYIESQNNKIKSLKKDIKKAKWERKKTENSLKTSEKKYKTFSEYKKHTRYKSRFGSKVRALEKVHKNRIKEYEKNIEDLTKNLKNLENTLRTQEAFKTKAESLYKKYSAAKK